MGRSILVTGGSGYFGEILAGGAVAHGDRVRVFDLNPPAATAAAVEFVQGDVRDPDAVRAACNGVDVVLHNVAQVPLARDRELFRSVNVVGTANLLVAARDAGVGKVVHTSSSAVFGIPDSNPVTEETPCRPVESYGRAKLEAEVLCREAVASGLDVTIIRPRTILGHGRLGIFGVLFEFVADGAPVYVLGAGDNRYQFVHAADLADACLRAASLGHRESYESRLSKRRSPGRTGDWWCERFADSSSWRCARNHSYDSMSMDAFECTGSQSSSVRARVTSNHNDWP